MNYLFRNKLLTGLVILLLVANIITLATFWMDMKKNHPNPQQPSAFIIKELSLDNKQQAQYLNLVQQHRQQSKLIQVQVRDNKDSLFNLLSVVNINDSVRKNFITKIALLNGELDSITFEHFKEVRKICTPNQQKKFDEIIKEVLRMMVRPGPLGHRPPGDGPPPAFN